MVAREKKILHEPCINWERNKQVKKNIFRPDPAEDRTRDPPHKNPTLYRVAIKAGLYRKAVQVFIYTYAVTQKR